MAAERLTCIERIDQIPDDILAELEEWYCKGDPLYQIDGKIKQRGYRLKNPALIMKWCRTLFPLALRDHSEDPTEKWIGLPEDEQAVRLLWNKVLACTKMIDPAKKAALPKLTSLTAAAARLATAKAHLKRTEIEVSRAAKKQREVLEKAKEELLYEFRKVVPDNPELLQQLLTIFDQSVSQVSTSDDEHTVN